jgi:hypothetical protein
VLDDPNPELFPEDNDRRRTPELVADIRDALDRLNEALDRLKIPA